MFYWTLLSAVYLNCKINIEYHIFNIILNVLNYQIYISIGIIAKGVLYKFVFKI